MPPDTGSVAAQNVKITYESPGGRKSNAWSAKFVPRLALVVVPWQFVHVSCSNQSAYDNCNNPNRSGYCWSDPPSTIPGIVGYDPPEDGMIGEHHGCWGISSDNGTDTYSVAVRNGWMITRITNFSGIVNNASFSDNTNPSLAKPTTIINVNVPWHIGATGGDIWYNADIQIEGPAGISPYQ